MAIAGGVWLYFYDHGRIGNATWHDTSSDTYLRYRRCDRN